MELANQVMYLGFGLIFFGLSFNAFHDLKIRLTLQSSRAYWAFSLCSMWLSCFFLTIYPFTGGIALTLGNLAQVAVDVGLVLLFRSLNKHLKKSLVATLLFLLIPLAVILELIRAYANYDIRVNLLSWTGIFLSAWQVYELIICNSKSKSIYLSFISLAVTVQILLWLYRIWMVDQYVDFNGHASVFDEHVPEFIARLILIVLYALIFIGIANYYYDSLVQAEKRRREDKEEQMLIALKALASARDNDTGNHIIRTQHYVKVLAQRLKEMGFFEKQLDSGKIHAMYKAAPLHDIGKVGIPDHILLKQGELSAVEWEVMKTHASIGESVLQASEEHLQVKDQVIEYAIRIAGAHHERWDGTGYPNGLRGEDIPLEARIMALADMYDALVTQRPYKKSWPHEDAVQEIMSKKGTHLDPVVVEAFVYEQSQFKEIAKKFKD